jgi:uncharacterized protein (TIGR02118 family)
LEFLVLKFVVLLYRKQGMSYTDFVAHTKDVHGPLAMRLPGLKKYVQNFVVDDVQRSRPDWDAMVELYFADRASFEAAWETPEGKASDADLPLFLDLTRTSWSIVDEVELL